MEITIFGNKCEPYNKRGCRPPVAINDAFASQNCTRQEYKKRACVFFAVTFTTETKSTNGKRNFI